MPTVLLVDDEAIIRLAFAECLLDNGITSVQAASGGEALERLHGEAPIDLVVTDLVLQGNIQGNALIKKIQTDFPDMPIVVIGGDLRHLESLQVSRTFAKPFNLQAAVDAIKELMGLSALPHA